MAIVTVDSKGRIMLPREMRQALQVQPGDALFLTRDGQFIALAKAENPFDRLAAHAVAAYFADDTVTLDEARDSLDEADAG